MDAPTRLRAWRAAVDLSQAEAGALIGCHQATIARIEDGSTSPSPLTRAAIERVTAGHELAVTAASWEPAAEQASEPDAAE